MGAALALAAGAALAPPARAQESSAAPSDSSFAAEPVERAGRTLDRTVAAVGGEVILLSEIDEEVLLSQARTGADLADPDTLAAARDRALEGLLEARILLAEAHDEGIRATREEIEEAVVKMMADLKSRFPTEQAFEAQLARENMTVAKLEATYRERMRDQLEIGKLVDREVRSKADVEALEVRAYYDAHRAEIPTIPASLDVRRIRVSLRAPSVVDSAAIARAGIVRDRLRRGEDFATLARVFSEGPEAAKGGDLGWFRAGDLDPLLDAAVAALNPGQVSDVVASARGTHLLEVMEREGERFRLRQIVFLRNEEAAKAAARARIESARARLDRGEDFVALAQEISDEAGDASQRGRVVKVSIEALDPRFRGALENLEPGAISGTVEDPEGFSIFRVEAREGEREPAFEEIRERLEALVRQEKTEKLYDEYLAKIRAETFVEILPEPKS